MKNKQKHLLLIILMALLSGCALGGSSTSSDSSNMSYKDLKSMVIDILKTEDAQKALQESYASQSGLSAQSNSILPSQDQELIRTTVKDVLLSPDYDDVIKSIMSDTKFAAEFATAVNDMNKDLHIELVKDPQYQEGLVEAFESEQLQKVILKAVKTPDYRKEIMSLMQETMKNPIFKMQVLDLMKQAVADELSVKAESSGGGGGDSGGGEGSGGKEQSKDKGSGGGDSEEKKSK